MLNLDFKIRCIPLKTILFAVISPSYKNLGIKWILVHVYEFSFGGHWKFVIKRIILALQYIFQIARELCLTKNISFACIKCGTIEYFGLTHLENAWSQRQKRRIPLWIAESVGDIDITQGSRLVSEYKALIRGQIDVKAVWI